MPQPVLRSLGRVVAEDEEVSSNARARSAILRVAERTETPLPAEGGFAFVKIGALPGSDLAPPPRRGGKGGRR
ncbi:hypothetical protein D9M69_718860 [compost metagenome]